MSSRGHNRQRIAIFTRGFDVDEAKEKRAEAKTKKDKDRGQRPIDALVKLQKREEKQKQEEVTRKLNVSLTLRCANRQ
jgi:hypothetical protein